MSFPYKHVLLIGATSGVGRAMAERFITEGVKVTAVGRRQDRLDKFVTKHGKDKASSICFDISKLDEVPGFVDKALREHAEIDCFFLNAGVQGRANFAQLETVDLAGFQREVTVNFSAHVALVHAILPHILKRKEQIGLIFTGTQVNVVPVYVMPAYSASKAALDAFIMCLREQMKGTNVKVMNIIAGPIQTELHNAEMGEEEGQKFGMPLKELVDEVYDDLSRGKDDLYPGTVGGSTKEQFLEIVGRRDEAFVRMSDIFRYIAQNS